MKILVGFTGLVGKTLLRQTEFDLTFNSKNIGDFATTVPEGSDLYLSCLPATKWSINQSTESKIQDCINCLDIIKILSQKSYNKIILISSIDVYLNSEIEADEDVEIISNGIGYGENRLMFEKLVKNELKYNSIKIYRIPALFGSGLKKNVLFDLINNNNTALINKNSYYQWYNLDNLWSDILNYGNTDGYIVNLFTEPVFTGDIVDTYFDSKLGFMSEFPVIYNYKTKFSEDGYIDSSDSVLKQIGEFINEARS